jgi:hypothetical protein
VKGTLNRSPVKVPFTHTSECAVFAPLSPRVPTLCADASADRGTRGCRVTKSAIVAATLSTKLIGKQLKPCDISTQTSNCWKTATDCSRR